MHPGPPCSCITPIGSPRLGLGPLNVYLWSQGTRSHTFAEFAPRPNSWDLRKGLFLSQQQEQQQQLAEQ